MGDERFSALALLNIESDLTAALNPEDLVQMYATTGTRRIKMQWSFLDLAIRPLSHSGIQDMDVWLKYYVKF